MHVISARNVHCALPMGINYLLEKGLEKPSRNGTVTVAVGPVTTLYTNPTERVLFWPQRDANPFLHLFESLWMLAGRADVGYPAQFAANMNSYSDDGKTLWGAYGFRWRKWFDHDQLDWAINRLTKDPHDRRVVISMYDAKKDQVMADAGGKDIPCNLTIALGIGVKGLDMTVFNRSNDIIWGAYGANAVHFSVLQEYLAGCIGVPVGYYWQISNNYHGYHKTLLPLRESLSLTLDEIEKSDPYAAGVACKPSPIMSTSKKSWDMDLALFMEDPTAIGFNDSFFRRVAIPMWMAHRAFKRKDDPDRHDNAATILVTQCKGADWRRAALEWIARRKEKSNGGN